MLIKTSSVQPIDVKAHIEVAIRATMTQVVRDKFVLAQVVAHGPEQWRQTFMGAMRAAGLRPDPCEADRTFAFFCEQYQRWFTAPAARVLDAIDVVTPRQFTAQEIAESLELESGSTDAGRDFVYGGRTKDEAMRALKGEIESTMRVESEP